MKGENLLKKVPVGDLAAGGDLDAFVTAGHGAGFGMTGSGKTVAIRWFAESLRSFVLVFNPEDEPMPGARCESPEELWKAIKDRQRKVNYVPPDGGAAEAHLEAIRLMLFKIGNAMRAKRGGRSAPPWCVVLVDEVHQVSTKADRDGPIHRFFKLARKRGIVIWVWSQEPSEVAHICLTQPQFFMLWEVKAFRVPYLEEYGLPMSVIWPHLQKPYHYAVVSKNAYSRCIPVPES